jgi:hypothetical protein
MRCKLRSRCQRSCAPAHAPRPTCVSGRETCCAQVGAYGFGSWYVGFVATPDCGRRISAERLDKTRFLFGHAGPTGRIASSTILDWPSAARRHRAVQKKTDADHPSDDWQEARDNAGSINCQRRPDGVACATSCPESMCRGLATDGCTRAITILVRLYLYLRHQYHMSFVSQVADHD